MDLRLSLFFTLHGTLMFKKNAIYLFFFFSNNRQWIWENPLLQYGRIRRRYNWFELIFPYNCGIFEMTLFRIAIYALIENSPYMFFVRYKWIKLNRWLSPERYTSILFCLIKNQWWLDWYIPSCRTDICFLNW